MSLKREVWVDYIKTFACVLVVLGHFFQSMVKAQIIPDNHVYEWFNTTIYYFHVPLFFICSGYLYQRYSNVDSWDSWKNNVIKKAVALGIPYFIFSFATWLLKTVFSSSVNEKIGGLMDTLFLHPASPYWYLYILFLIFLVTPTAKNTTGITVMLGLSIVLKAVSIVMADALPLKVFAVSKVFQNEIWFVIGMLLVFIKGEKLKQPVLGAILGILFIGLSIVVYKMENGFISFAMGLAACLAVIMMAYSCNEQKGLTFLSKYTMPIFLMHTLFAALTRIVLLKININSPAIHLAAGIIMSFAGPILAAIIMKHLKIDWILSPRIKLKSKES
ncbi:MAG: acyltransferase [Clostridia bacterium]|nr:acyltransferase [Clostridia bacterium]